MHSSLAWAITAFIGVLLLIMFWMPLTALLTRVGVEAAAAYGLAFLLLLAGPPVVYLVVRDRL